MTIADRIRSYRRSPTPQRPLLIAEVGVNHEGSMETARRLISLAAEGGADGVKFQTYRAETLAARESPAYWDLSMEPTTSQYELFKKHDAFWKSEFEALKLACDDAGVEFLSTPFDLESAEFLSDLMSVVKVSSSDVSNLPFIRALAGYRKPMLISTGAAYLWEVAEAVQAAATSEAPTCLMHCTLSYPAQDRDANLGMIADLARHFPDTVPGYSDHTLPNAEMDVLVNAAMIGAFVIEKHFTHDKKLPGNDHYHAMDVGDLRAFWRKWDRTTLLLGRDRKEPIAAEAPARRHARRSLVAATSIAAGQVLTAGHLTWKRPASGISPREIDAVIGRVARKPIAADQILQWSMLDEAPDEGA